jgi:hypothetical protein
MRSLRVRALRGLWAAVPVWIVVTIAAELLIDKESTTNAIGVPLAFLACGVVLVRGLRLYLRLDPEGIHVRNFLDTQDVPWNEVVEIIATRDFAFQSTVGFRLRHRGERLRRIAAAQVSADIAPLAQRRELLEVVRRYAHHYDIPLRLELGPDRGWRVPVDAYDQPAGAPTAVPQAGDDVSRLPAGQSGEAVATRGPGDTGQPRYAPNAAEKSPARHLMRTAFALLMFGAIIASVLIGGDYPTAQAIWFLGIGAALGLAIVLRSRRASR